MYTDRVSVREPILDLSWEVRGYEILTDRNVILGNREFIFSNLPEFLDLILFEIHSEEAKKESKDIFVNIRPQTLVAFKGRLSRFISPNLVVEIREDHADVEILRSIGELKDKTGLRICVDDFGTGSSNIERLLLLKPDFVKLDMRVFSPLPYACRKLVLKNLVDAIRTMTDAVVIFEKVEKLEDLEIASEVGADLWQGFLSRYKLQGMYYFYC